MEKRIFKYLEFLLPIHNCVTLPDFGGFIINMRPSVSGFNYEAPPQYSIVFNPELNHNDGIIASYISKNENISYNTACKKIKDVVKKIQSDLKAGKAVSCSNIGILSTDTYGSITFSSNKENVYPALYGLRPVGMKQLIYINDGIRKEKRNVSLKYISGGVAAAIAAILLFAGPNTEITDANHKEISKAGFLSSITTLSKPDKVDKSLIINNIVDSSLLENKVNIVSKPTRTYYIIVGGEENKSQAERLLSRIQSADFPDAAIVDTPDRYRIYVSSFGDKKQAEAYLESFRKENPKYETAWLYSLRNK